MRIVSWNCNGKFREKFQDIILLDADIYIIQECENPSECNCAAYKEFAQNYYGPVKQKQKDQACLLAKTYALRKTNGKNIVCVTSYQ